MKGLITDHFDLEIDGDHFDMAHVGVNFSLLSDQAGVKQKWSLISYQDSVTHVID